MRRRGAVLLALTLAGCGHSIVPAGRPSGYAPPPVAGPVRPRPAVPIAPAPAASPPASAVSAATSGVLPGPAVAQLGIDREGAVRALAAFRLSCPTLMRRTDVSGLTSGGDWAAACAQAQTTGDGDAQRFFERNFETAQIADGKAFATGYFEPQIDAALRRGGRYQTPVYGKPDDLIEVDLSLFSDTLKGKKVRGRVEGQNFVPYYDRAAIEDGALDGRGLEIAWAADPIELFFMEVQGSGRLCLPDGRIMRVGYAGQNGRDYTGIGKLMRDRGLLAPGQANMQGIIDWLRGHPREGRDIMRENKSYVFFRELTGPGPLGALGLPVTGRASVAADPNYIPMGAPVFLSMDRADATGLWVAQDTGGAIKGANRFDTFWGAGADARTTAGGMSAHGTAFLLLPLGTLARLGVDGRAAP